MVKEVDADQKRAELQADKFRRMSDEASRLGKLRQCLALVRGLINSVTPSNSRVIVAFNENKNRPHGSLYGSPRDDWQIIVSELPNLSVPILGAAETTLREQIRKQESSLQELGVTNV